jgi:PleD family two-component response regulator
LPGERFTFRLRDEHARLTISRHNRRAGLDRARVRRQMTAAPEQEPRPTVLLVEDEQSIGRLVRGYLENAGHRVVSVRSGEEALAELDRHGFGIVVLDIGLPGMDGFDVCRRIRARSTVPM